MTFVTSQVVRPIPWSWAPWTWMKTSLPLRGHVSCRIISSESGWSSKDIFVEVCCLDLILVEIHWFFLRLFYSFHLPCLFSCILFVIVSVRTFWSAGSKARSTRCFCWVLVTPVELWSIIPVCTSAWEVGHRRRKVGCGWGASGLWTEMKHSEVEGFSLGISEFKRLRPRPHETPTTSAAAPKFRSSFLDVGCPQLSSKFQGLETHIFKLEVVVASRSWFIFKIVYQHEKLSSLLICIAFYHYFFKILSFWR